VIERERQTERETESDRERERKTEREIIVLFLTMAALKGMTGALAPFSYLVL